jgi:uncharacterized protein YjdB
MAMNRSRCGLIFVFLASLTCGKDATGPASGAVESIIVSPPLSTVAIGAQVALVAQVLDETGTALLDRPVHWASEDETIVTVSSDGLVTARRIGTVQVAASTGGHSGIAQVTVTAIPVATVRVTPGNRSLFVGESFQFTAETRSASGGVLTGRPISWASNNERVATVSANGTVTALAPGGAIVTASSEGKTDQASITVSAIPVASVRVTPTSQSLIEGQTAQLQAQPLDGAGKPLTGRVVMWSTNRPNVATVTSTGLVTAQAPGSATITATVEGKSGTTAVTVTPRPPNAVVVTPAQVLVQQDGTAQVTAQVLDDLGRVIPNSTVTFSSADPAIATVSSAGLVRGIAAGQTAITATSGTLTGTARVTVTPIPVGSVVVTPGSPVITVGKTIQLSAQAVSATGQPLPGRTVTWTSSAAAVAAVSSSGLVSAASPGSTVIFASIDGVLGWTDVTVMPVPVASVSVSPPTSSVTVGQAVQFSAVLQDASGNTLSGRVISWSSDQPGVAAVTSAGLVTAMAAGTAVITATSEGQSGTATVTVTGATLQTLAVTPDTATIAPLGSVQLTAVVRDGTGAVINNAPVAWSSSNPLVAGVNNNGLVSGLLPGTTVITAASGQATGTATISVK